MKEQDLSTFMIEDSEFFNSKAIYVNFFRRKKLTTVDQLLNANYMELVTRASYSTRVQLKAFISMLRHKYLGEPLAYDSLLDSYLQIDMSTKDSFHAISVIDQDGCKKIVNLANIFGCPLEEIERVFARFENDMLNREMNKEKYKLPSKEIKLIDFFKWEGLSKFRVFSNYANEYVQEYNKNKELEDPKDEIIEDLKNQILSLTKTVEHLQYSVEYLQEQINVLTKDKGSVKK